MRAAWLLLPALAALSAYYVYLPLPGAVSDPWKLMLLDATFRAVQQTVRRPRLWIRGRTIPAALPEAMGSAVTGAARSIPPGPARPGPCGWSPAGCPRVGDIAGRSWAGPAAPGHPPCRGRSGFESLCNAVAPRRQRRAGQTRVSPLSVRPSVCPQRCPGPWLRARSAL